MTDAVKPVDYLHGVTLEQLLTQLVDHFGWTGMADLVRINCFRSNPSIRSSLTFLRRTPWARTQVELIYCQWRAGADVTDIRLALKRAAQSAKPARSDQLRNDPSRNSQSRHDKPRSAQTKTAIDPWHKSR